MKQKSLIKNSFYNILRTFATLFFPLIIFVYASRILGPEGIGRVEFTKNISSYFVLLASLGINNYGIREGAKLRESKNEFSKFVQEILCINIISTIFSLCIFFSTIHAVPLLADYKPYLYIFSITIFLSPMGVEWLYGAIEEYKYIAIRTVIFQIIALITLFVIVKNENDVFGYAIVLIISSVGSNVMNLIHMRKFVYIRKYHNYNIKRHLFPILILFVLAISNSLYSYIDTTLLGFMVDDHEVGLYTAALKVNRIIVNVIGAIGAVIMPRLSYLWANEHYESFEKITKQVFNIILMFSIPCSIGIIFLARPLVEMFCGVEYIESITTMQLLSVIIVFLSLSTFFNMHILVPINKEKHTIISILMGFATNLIVSIILIPMYFRNGAAIGTILGEFVVMMISYYFVSKEISIELISLKHLQYVLASIPVGAICILSQHMFIRAYMQNIFSILMSIPAYIISLLVLKNEYIHTAIEMIKKFVRRKP